MERRRRTRSRPRHAAGVALAALVSLSLTPAASAASTSAPSTPVRTAPGDCTPLEVEAGFIPLFDGTQASLDLWSQAGPGSFELHDDCSMETTGGMGLLWFPEEFSSYRLRLDWMMAGDDNSGVFVGFPDPGDDPWIAVDSGYEIQIDATDEPDRTTAAIYTIQGADPEARDAALNPPGEWNSYEILVDDPRIEIRLNGVLVNSFVSTDPARDLSSGFIGLQNHGADDSVRFRHVRIADLDSTGTPPSPGRGFYLADDWDSTADHEFSFGRVGDEILAGDWDGDGRDTLAVRRGNAFFLTNSTTGGYADATLTFGRAGDDVLVGDWDGDGNDSLAVHRGRSVYLRPDLDPGSAVDVVNFGRESDSLLAGDWDGDGVDTLAARRGHQIHVSNRLASGAADSTLSLGRPGDHILAGDWDGDGVDSFAVRRGNVFLLFDSSGSAVPAAEYRFGRSGDDVVVGDWDGDGDDTPGVRR
jgi:hypothetical protein